MAVSPTGAARRWGGPVTLRLGVACLLALVALAAAVATSATVPLPGDPSVLRWAVAHRPPAAASVARGLTATGIGVVPYLVAAVAGLFAGRRLRGGLWAVLVCPVLLAIGQGLRYALVVSIARPRPPAGDRAAVAAGWSFPSGHTTTSALAAGLLIGAVLVRAPRHGRPVIAVATCWAVAVGLTRSYLGVHWASDVVGGWLFATTWLCLCALLASRVLPARWYGRRTPDAPEPGGARPMA